MNSIEFLHKWIKRTMCSVGICSTGLSQPLVRLTSAHLTILKTSWHHWWTLSLKAAGVDMWRWGSLLPPVCIDNINAYPSASHSLFFCLLWSVLLKSYFQNAYGSPSPFLAFMNIDWHDIKFPAAATFVMFVIFKWITELPKCFTL